MSEFDLTELKDSIIKESQFINHINTSIRKVIIGQDDLIEKLILAILTDGHVFLEGVPGLAKTLTINSLAKLIDTKFQRLQFTPDLLPADILGTLIYNPKEGTFEVKKGPIFANIILADEINRTPPKTQSALLEAMQEKSVTNAGKTYNLDKPFFVLATQNPIEQEGTYPLPEAQLDRFMFNVVLDYPSYDEEVQIVKQTTSGILTTLNTIMNSEDIIKYQDLIRRIPVADNVLEYVVSLVTKTRPNSDQDENDMIQYIEWGAGPRASQFMLLAAKCHAAINGKYSPDIEDVKAVAKPILRHRLVKNYKAEAEGISVDNIIENLM